MNDFKDGYYYYLFQSVGLRGLFILTEDIEICKEQAPFFRSFLVSDALDSDWKQQEDFLRKRKLIDFSVIFRPCERLPEMEKSVYPYEDACYCLNDTWERFQFETWHSKSPGNPPYAYVHWIAPGQMEVLYLADHSYMVSLSRQLFNIVGLESVFLDYQRFLLHSSLIDYKGKGILFSAPSGSGKSTQADLWMKYADAEILNGDVAGICKGEDGYYAYGVPWAGSSGIYRNESVKVSMIVMLSKGPDNVLNPMSAPMAVMNLYSQVFMHRFDRAFVDVSMGMIEEMVGKVPVYSFSCRPDEDAVKVVKEELLRLSDFKAGYIDDKNP